MRLGTLLLLCSALAATSVAGCAASTDEATDSDTEDLTAADAAVVASLKRLDLPRERLDREQTTRLLDDLGRQEGLAGMTVRFVRAKIVARLGG